VFADTAIGMAATIWIPLAIATALAISTAAALAVGAILGEIGAEIGQLLESESLAFAPVTPAEPVARAR
jgi:hypothetical protein